MSTMQVFWPRRASACRTVVCLVTADMHWAHLNDINEVVHCGVLFEQQVAIVDFVLLHVRQQQQ